MRGRGKGDQGEVGIRNLQTGDFEERIMHERREKIAGMQMPYRSNRDSSTQDVLVQNAHLEAGEENPDRIYTVAGRMMAQRIAGKIAFADVTDQSGKVQLFVSKGELGDDLYADFKNLDLGDWIEAKGYAKRTPRGEISIHVQEFKLLAKCLRPLPDKHNGLVDPEKRLSQRYLDLVANEGVRDRFLTRSRIVSNMRRYLEDLDFAEVETPLLQPVYGGAAARPFTSHHNEMDKDFFLRISPELYLKRLLVGGMERVFETGRSLRNEGVSQKHNPEFTMIELYQAHADYNDMMDLTENMVRHIAENATGETSFDFKGQQINVAEPFRRAKYRDLVLDATGLDIENVSVDQLQSYLKDHKQVFETDATWTDLVDDVFGHAVEPNLIQPTFVTDFPAEMSPLAREHRDNPFYAERFEMIIAGMELANAYSEQNDPDKQFARLKELSEQSGEQVDEDYIRALSYGMPPAGGMGMGIDRLCMVLTGQSSIRETILFPARRQ